MNNHKARANLLHVAVNDSTSAYEYLLEIQRLDRNVNYKQCEALLIAAIILYARPFKRSYSNGVAEKYVEVDLESALPGRSDLQKLHELVIDRRDRAVAHADWEFHNSHDVSLLPDGPTLRAGSVFDYFGGISVEEFSELSLNMLSYLRREAYENDRLANQV